jgi:hypothetical protein
VARLETDFLDVAEVSLDELLTFFNLPRVRISRDFVVSEAFGVRPLEDLERARLETGLCAVSVAR